MDAIDKRYDRHPHDKSSHWDHLKDRVVVGCDMRFAILYFLIDYIFLSLRYP